MRVALCVALLFASALCLADDASKFYGWRGNGTGLFPDSKAPTEWSLISTGAMEGLKCGVTSEEKDAAPVEGGLITKWLVIGPFAVKDGTADFARELIPGEATLTAVAGEKVGELEWRAASPATDGVSFKSVNTGGVRGKQNEGGLAITCLFAARPGKLRAVIEHPVQAKVFANGKEVYSNEKYGVAMGSAYGQSNNRVAMTWPVAPSFEFDVKQGWNRLTVKVVSPNRAGWNDLIFMMRLGDAPPVKYASKNILWHTDLGDHGHGCPVIVGDKVFVTSEPDELICIDKNTGKVLWSATNTYWDAVPQAERDANPAFKEKVIPAAEALSQEKDPVNRWAARKKLYDALIEVDKKKYGMNFDGHLQGHFDIVGFTNTPVSDGKHVYFWNGAGVAACYDLDGKRKWIRRLESPKLFYSCAPAVIGGKLAVYFVLPPKPGEETAKPAGGEEHPPFGMFGLDAATGATAWIQPGANKNVASFLSARIAGVDVFISQQGEIVRASDGKMLWANPHKITNDTGWAPPLVLGDVVYIPWYGNAMIWVEDFTGCQGDEWKSKESVLGEFGKGFPPLPKAPLGIGREQTAGSPLIYDGKIYEIDWCGGYYVIDQATSKTLACREVGLKGDANYVAMPACASPTLIGKYIYVMDNQGNTVVLEPGGECKVVAVNRIAMQVPRDWAITTQEYTAYPPPVADGNRIYIRGERHLYCIGLQ